jgi:hypothetical protein
MTTSYAQTTYSNTPARGFAGQVLRADIVVGKIQGEATAVIPFGYGVCPHASDSSKVILPAAETDRVIGILARSHEYMDGISYNPDVTPGGVMPGANLNIVRKGRMLVLAEDATTAYGRGWVRCTAGVAPEYVGGIVSADEGTETIDCTNYIEFQEAVAAQALVEIEFDFTRE